ncbi:MAG: redoxin family protein, partial [Patescibacteria group bacterium]
VTVQPRQPATSTSSTLISTPEKSETPKAKPFELAKEISTPDGFINTAGQPITIGELVGKKVVLVDFWTYSCINCQRTTPYLNAWYEKYREQGLEIIGLHTPEFEFEKKYDNVKAAVEKFGIKFPVVLDNDYSTWTAYRNRYWPRKYLIDIDGYIVYDHIGEGGYEETERKIQAALKERMVVLGESGAVSQTVTGEIAPRVHPASPETYFGAARNQLFANGKIGVAGEQVGLTPPAEPIPNKLYLGGDWQISREFAENRSANARIVYRYTAKDVFLVAEAEGETEVEIIRDGQPMTELKVKDAGLYELIQDQSSGTHTLEIIIRQPGLRAFTFTFG